MKSVALIASISFLLACPAQANPALRSLYPHLSDEAFEAKLRAADQPFRFFRSFVPLYYSLLSKDAGLLPNGIPAHVEGWCVGDAHPENFGTVVSKEGEVAFTLTDLDDAGPCPLGADALRFFTAITTNDPSTPLSPSIRAYLDGLRGAPREFSKPVRKMIEKAAKRKTHPPEEYDSITSRLERRDDTREITISTRHSIEVALSEAFGRKIMIRDALERIRMHGGSGGLQRYLALLASPDGSPEVLELKELVIPGIFPLASRAIPDAKERIETSVRVFGFTKSAPIRVAFLEGKPMLVRPRMAANMNVAIAKLTQNELADVLEDEAWILGNLHRSSAKETPYTDFALRTSASDWAAPARETGRLIHQIFASLGDSLGRSLRN